MNETLVEIKNFRVNIILILKFYQRSVLLKILFFAAILISSVYIFS